MRGLPIEPRSSNDIALQNISISSEPGTVRRQSIGQPRPPSPGHETNTDVETSGTSGAGTAVPPGFQAGRGSETSSIRRRRWGIVRFWKTHVSCDVELSASRDHLALERTFLGYLRTSVMMSMTGTMILQLFVISHQDSFPVNRGFGYFLMGKPLATLCYVFSIGTLLLGACRAWRQQHAIVRGKALAGGFEIHVLGLGSFLLLFIFFGFLVAVDIVKTKEAGQSL